MKTSEMPIKQKQFN